MGIWRRQALLHSSESPFGGGFFESGTPTWTRAVSVVGDIEATLEQERLEDASIQPRLDEMYPGHPGPRRGTLKFKQYLGGHSTAPTGAITYTDQGTLLSRGFGGGESPVGTTIATSTSASSFTLTSTTNWSIYTPGRVGTKGDARGDGQGFLYNGATGSYIALPAQPNVGDVVYGGMQLHPIQGAAVLYERFMIMREDTGAQYAAMGCALASLDLNLPIGQNALPEITYTYNVAYWRRIARTFPDALESSKQPQATAAITGGSVCFQDIGSATRVEKTVASLNVRINFALEPISGSVAGLGTYQDVAGWARTRCDADIEFSCPWETSFETWWDTANASMTLKRFLATLSCTPGSAVVIAAPRTFPTGMRPCYPTQINGQNYVTLSLKARYTAGGGTQIDPPIQLMLG